MDDAAVVSHPLSVRAALVVVTVALGVPAAFLAAEALESLVVLVAGLAGTVALTIRSARVCLHADRSRILVRNYFRTYRLRWENVSHVGISVTTSIGSQFTAVGLREQHGRPLVAAQATSSGREQRRVVRELATLRPDLPIHFSE